jgi:GTP 3',8-cyclase
MDVGTTNRWSLSQVVPAREVVARISAAWPLEPVGPAYRGEVASRYRYADGRGEIGIVSSVTEPFCRDCNRARLSADGRLFTCLFASEGQDVLGLVRSGSSDAEIARFIYGIWGLRSDRYSEERAGLPAAARARERIEMSYIGG